MMKGIDLKVYGTAPNGALLVSADEVNSGIQALIDENAKLQQRNAELAAQVNKLRVSATIVLNARDEDGITTSGLLKKFNELSEALSFLPSEYLAEHNREVAARAVEKAADYAASLISDKYGIAKSGAALEILDHKTDVVLCVAEYASKIKSGEVEV